MTRSFAVRLSSFLTSLALLTGCNLPVTPVQSNNGAAIVEPLDGAHYQTGAWVNVRTNASDAEGAVEVTLLVNDQPVRSDPLAVALQNGDMIQPWQPLEPGMYTLQTRMTSASGASFESNKIRIEIDTTPAVTITPSLIVPTEIPTLTPIPTLGPPIATASENAFCRLGPSQAYTDTGQLLTGQSSPVTGRNVASSWWVISAAYDGGTCWIWSGAVTVSGDLSGVPVVEPPPLPIPAPTLVSPSGTLNCSSTVHLIWNPVNYPNGIARYEWEVLGPGGTDRGETPHTTVETIIACGGASYKWRVRAVDSNGNAGPYSGFMKFTVQ